MKECSECGKKITVGPKAMEVQRKSVEYYQKTLKDEGAFLPVDTERSLKRFLFESQKIVNGDPSLLGYHKEGLCEKCSNEKHKDDELPTFGLPKFY